MNEYVYQTGGTNHITRLEKRRESKHSVWVKSLDGKSEIQYRKLSDSFQFHPSFDGAKKFLIDRKKVEIQILEARIDAEKKALSKIEQLEDIYGGENE